MTLLADYVRPIAAAVLKTKVQGALRYWPKEGGSSVVIGLTSAEIQDFIVNEVPFSTIYEERDPAWMGGGFAAGVSAAKWLQQQFTSTGYTPRCVYLAGDSNSLSTAAVNACLDGAASILGLGMMGLYGYLPQLKAAHDAGKASWYWLTGPYVDPAAYPWIHLYQCQGSQPAGIPTTLDLVSVTLDVDLPFATDWGQDPAPASPVVVGAHGVSEDQTMQLQPGANMSQTLTYPGKGYELVINIGWVPMVINKISFIGRTPASGVDWAGRDFEGPLRVDPARPFVIDLDQYPNTMSIEIDYSAPDTKNLASAGFRAK